MEESANTKKKKGGGVKGITVTKIVYNSVFKSENIVALVFHYHISTVASGAEDSSRHGLTPKHAGIKI